MRDIWQMKKVASIKRYVILSYLCTLFIYMGDLDFMHAISHILSTLLYIHLHSISIMLYRNHVPKTYAHKHPSSSSYMNKACLGFICCPRPYHLARTILIILKSDVDIPFWCFPLSCSFFIYCSLCSHFHYLFFTMLIPWALYSAWMIYFSHANPYHFLPLNPYPHLILTFHVLYFIHAKTFLYLNSIFYYKIVPSVYKGPPLGELTLPHI